MLGAGRVIAIDRVAERLEMAQKHGKAETINFDKDKVYDRLMEMTKGRGPDRCIDAVGCEAHAGGSFDAVVDKAKAALHLATDRAHVLSSSFAHSGDVPRAGRPVIFHRSVARDVAT